MEFFNINDLNLLLPLVILFGTSLVVMLLDAFGGKKALLPVTLLGLLLAIGFSLPGISVPVEVKSAFNEAVWFGGYISWFNVLLLFGAVLLLPFVPDFLTTYKRMTGDVYALILFAVLGMSILLVAKSLIVLFIGIETLSISFYILAGLLRDELRSNESALKYFLLGAFASSFIVFGIALLYGATGSMDLNEMLAVPVSEEMHLIYLAGIVMVLIGFLFKIAAFPFHAWSPDVYTGAPTPLSGFLAAGGKLSVFMAFGIFLIKVLPPNSQGIVNAIIFLSVLSMLYGNFTALRQTNLKRMLAYSSIAHTGYVLLAVTSGKDGYFAAVLYMTFYLLMTLGAFGLISMVQKNDTSEELDAWRGLGIKKPLLGFLMSVFMFSLAGMPPFAGFIGKYYVFSTALKAGFIVPAVIGILSSVVAAYYYLNVLVVMFFLKPKEEFENLKTPAQIPMITDLLIAFLLIILGVIPMVLSNNMEVLLWNAPF